MLMSILWAVAVVALVIAIAAWASARRTSRQLAELSAMYWQLKYDHGELKARLAPAAPKPADPNETFVPLAAIRKA